MKKLLVVLMLLGGAARADFKLSDWTPQDHRDECMGIWLSGFEELSDICICSIDVSDEICKDRVEKLNKKRRERGD